MENSNIGWTDHTFNPWIGCTKIDELCINCYAETLMDTRYGRVQWGKGKPRSRTSEDNWKQPLRWNRAQARLVEVANLAGEHPPRRPRVFCASLADWLDDDGVPIEWLSELLDLIRATPHLDWLLLTKRPQNWRARLDMIEGMASDANPVRSFVLSWLAGHAPANVCIGTSVGTQEGVDVRVPQLLRIPARVRFLSCEPLLEKIDLKERHWTHSSAAAGSRIHWVICGTESGAKRRTMHLDWARSLRDQCAAAGVAFFLKQIEVDRKIVTEPMLDGTPHLNFPEVRA